jgi:hypothetical protein
MQIDMYKKRTATMIVLAALGLSRLPIIGPAFTSIMQYNILQTGILIEYVLAGLAVYAAIMMYNKEI